MREEELFVPIQTTQQLTSLRCFLLYLFAGGVQISGNEAGGTDCWGLGGVGDGDAGVGVEALSPAGVSAATVAVVGEWSVPALAVMVACPRRQRWWLRRQRFPAVVVGEVAVGRLQETVNTCRPEAWQNVRRALKPLAKQRSYSPEKSAVETAGCGVGQAGSSTLAQTSPLTMLAHVAVGETREVRGREEMFVGWHPAGLAGLAGYPRGGGGGVAGVAGSLPYYWAVAPPNPSGGGGQVAGRASGWRRAILPGRRLAADRRRLAADWRRLAANSNTSISMHQG